MDTNFLELCARHTDRSLFSAIQIAMERFHGFDALQKHRVGNLSERLFWMLWTSISYINNEGLEQFLGLEGDRVFFAAALALFGCKEEGDFITRFCEIIQEPGMYVHWEKVREILQKLLGNQEACEQMENKFMESGDEIYDKLKEYVRAHLEDFSHLNIGPPEPYAVPGVAYLRSFWLWIQSFAEENNGRIPTLAELRRFVGQKHLAVGTASEDEYHIVQTGALPALPADAILVAYKKAILGKFYCLLGDGRIEERRGE